MHEAQIAALVTAALVVGSLVARGAADPDAPRLDAAADLAHRAVQWRATAEEDVDPLARLQHAAAALAYLQSARALARDDALERALGVDVSRLARRMERAVAAARQSAAGGAA